MSGEKVYIVKKVSKWNGCVVYQKSITVFKLENVMRQQVQGNDHIKNFLHYKFNNNY
jgi:hypothetical protein